MKKDTYPKNLELYDKLISMTSGIERKGKTGPYTSANGYMSSQINKDGEIGIRLPKDKREKFLKEYQKEPFKSYGAIMKEYVLIPESLLNRLDSHDYVNSLKSKK
jgi:hypothetical protein